MVNKVGPHQDYNLISWHKSNIIQEFNNERFLAAIMQ